MDKFLPLSLQFKIVVYKLSQFGRVKNLSFGKGLKEIFGARQKEYLSNSLVGLTREQDVLLSTRTGGSKSLCYQGFPSVWSDFGVFPREYHYVNDLSTG